MPATSVYQAGAIKLEEELSPAEAFETGMGEAAYTYLADHATKRVVIDVPAYKHATVTVRGERCRAAAAIAATSRRHALVAVHAEAGGRRPPLPARASWIRAARVRPRLATASWPATQTLDEAGSH